MGRLELYRCRNWLCRYSTKVSGGGAAGFYSYTNTVVCRKCHTLQDICVHYDDPDDPNKQIPPARCKKCGRQDFVDWNKGDPCPKCRRKMEIVPGHRVMWD